jgi:Ricin-type beta-trefoil lectin domain-like
MRPGRIRSRGGVVAGALALLAAQLVIVAQPAHAAPFPRFVSVSLDQVRQFQRPGSVTLGSGGSYKIVAPDAPGCVRMDADSATVGRNGGKVQTFGCNGSHNQNWAFDETSVPGLYRIRTGANGKCLDEDNSTGGAALSRLQMWDCLGTGQLNQFFWIVRNPLWEPDPSDPNKRVGLWLLSNIDDTHQALLADDGWRDGGDVVVFDRGSLNVQEKWMLQTF